ncbi:hypothetical protein DSO57_1025935 [Entomophthora muscae]|uniref:Uncharacterized protein n=1 Tax=Entomophthora muscae TaxID=34485 RepID=A0ACC2SFJ1_9FUNG|nr:hypothetical protein DSO57_1025935 [Entomophthora muscae]
MNTSSRNPSSNEFKSLSKAEVDQEVQKYQSFIQFKLLPELKVAENLHSELLSFSDEYIKLKATIEAIQVSKQKSIKTKIDLGCGVFAQANVPDARYIYVSVGHGFHLQLTLLEAVKFVNSKLEIVARKIEKSSIEVMKIRSHIKAVEEGLVDLVKA